MRFPRLGFAGSGVLALAVVLGAAAVASGAGVQGKEPVRWKVPIAFSSSLQALGDTLPWVTQRIGEISGGAIRLDVVEPGVLVPGNEVFAAVSAGKTEAGYTWIGYELGTVPAAVLFGSVPFGMDPWEYMAWFYFGGGKELAREVWLPHNIVPILCGLVGPETAGWFRFELTSLDQVKGLKIRFAGIGGKVMQKMGASVTMMPAGELRHALEKGVIDATEFSIPSADEQLGFYTVVKYNYFPGWHQPFSAQALYVNKDAWAKLTPPEQTLIETTCMAGVTYSLSKAESLQGAVLKRYADAGVTTVRLSPQILASLRKATDEVLAEEAGKDALFKKVLESQQAFDATYRPWQALAYLPPGSR